MPAYPGSFRVPDLQPLLAPRSIAVIGASDRPGAGSIVLDNLRKLGYPGCVYPVNPKYAELAGWPCYGSLKDLPGPIDSAAILLSSRQVLTALQQAADAGARAAWVLASGFAEAGPEGEALQEEVTNFARDHRIELCGPNCIGVVNLHARAAMYSTALPATIKPGRVGAVLQSGAVCLGIANANRGIGFSALISSGNEAGLDNSDYIAYLADDPNTHVIIAFIEGFRHPDRFVWAADRARTAGKPLLVVKVGRSAVAQRAVTAHTGSLAGADVVHDAVMREHGVVRLDSLDELLEAAELFLKAPLPKGRGVAMLTLSGGQIGLIGDVAARMNLELPEISDEVRQALGAVLPPYSAIANPLDAWGAGNFEETYPACMEILARDEKAHLIAVSRDSSPGIAEREIWQSMVIVDAAARVAQGSGKPVVIFGNVSTGLEPATQQRADAVNLPLLQGTSESLRAIEALIEYAEFTRRVPERLAASPVDASGLAHLRAGLAAQPEALSESASKRLLEAFGVPVTRELLADSAEAAAHAAESLGFPVVLKIHSPDVQHKTEAGGVVLNVGDPSEARRAYEDIVRSVGVRYPEAAIEGILVQEMVPAGAIEVIVGSANDPEFGPVVVFGFGGVLVELVKDSTLRLAPVTLKQAREMINSIRGAALLRGFRGRGPADVEALADAIVRVSHLASELRNEIAAVDVNPLMVLPKGRGVLAADALIIKHRRSLTGEHR